MRLSGMGFGGPRRICSEPLFSSDHGLLPWTPIVILALAGFFLFLKQERPLAAYFIIVFWRCVILSAVTPLGTDFFLWQSVLHFPDSSISWVWPFHLSELARWLGKERRAMAIVSSVIALLISWNLAFIFQWGTHMVPARGPISWRQMVRNQFTAVPQRAVPRSRRILRNAEL